MIVLASAFEEEYMLNWDGMQPISLSLGVDSSMKAIGFYSVSIEGKPDVYDDASQLSSIQDSSCKTIIASHVLEHFNYSGRGEARSKKVIDILKVWGSKLVDGGTLYISVPDWEKLISVMLKYKDSYWNIGKTPFVDVIGPFFGGMNNAYNVHSMLFNFSFLKHCLEESGFKNVSIVEDVSCFTEFNGSSKHWCSVNVRAVK